MVDRAFARNLFIGLPQFSALMGHALWQKVERCLLPKPMDSSDYVLLILFLVVIALGRAALAAQMATPELVNL